MSKIKYRCLTNNPMVYNREPALVRFITGNPLDLFRLVKEEVLKGYRLITHPLSSNLPPNMNPYKTVFLSLEAGEEVDKESLEIIDKAISYGESLMETGASYNWDGESLDDFQFVDLDLIKDLL